MHHEPAPADSFAFVVCGVAGLSRTDREVDDRSVALADQPPMTARVLVAAHHRLQPAPGARIEILALLEIEVRLSRNRAVSAQGLVALVAVLLEHQPTAIPAILFKNGLDSQEQFVTISKPSCRASSTSHRTPSNPRIPELAPGRPHITRTSEPGNYASQMATPDQRAADLADWCSHARFHKPAILAGGTESDSQHSRSERGVGSSGAI